MPDLSINEMGLKSHDKFKCKKHGELRANLVWSFSYPGMSLGKIYCVQCIEEFLEKNFEKVEAVWKDKA